MKEMYFKNILISDVVKHKARFQEFSKGFNVITSTENHVGKSSLVKSLYYTLGAEVGYDNIWDKNTKLYVVTINVDGMDYKVARFQKNFAIFEGESLILLTNSVSRDLAKKIEEILGFSIYLPNKRSKKIELAPPAFTYMPYYIDQDTGWNGLYNSFSNLDQYRKPDRIKSLYFHLNIFTQHTVELMAQKDELRDENKQLEKDKERIHTILEGLSEEIQNLLPAESVDELEKNLKIPKDTIAELVNNIGEIRNKIQSLETTLHKHRHQLNVIKEYNHIKGDIPFQRKMSIHICPQCGYTFDEEIYDIVRSNYNICNEDYMCQQIELIINSISEELEENKIEYVKLMKLLKNQEEAFDESQDAYEIYTRQRGLRSSVIHFRNQIGEKEDRSLEIESTIKSINKELRKLPNKKEIEEKYIAYVRENIIKLEAWNSTYEGKIKLLKPIKAQGTLENKIILAQVVGVFQTMKYFQSNVVRLPFVIDSPRSKEASNASSRDIIKLIFEIDMLPQVILATMDYDTFSDDIKKEVNVISLNEKKKLLNDVSYIHHQKEIIDYLELLQNI